MKIIIFLLKLIQMIELLISKSNSEVELLENFIFNYELDIEINKTRLIVNFSSVSLFPQ